MVVLDRYLFVVGPVVADLKDALFTLVLIALSYTVYFFAVHRKSRPLPLVQPEKELAAND
jgi:hypothetical protein